MRSQLRKAMVLTALAVGMAVQATEVAAQPLRRDLASYFLLAQRRASLKDFKLDSACNIGVNCPGIQGDNNCGTLTLADPTFDPASQAVSENCYFRKPGGRIGQLFCNYPDSLANVQILVPPVQSWTPPILAGTCGPACAVNLAAMEAACGFPAPFPACNPGVPVKVERGGDCSVIDAAPGNGVCDLPPGVYGNVNVTNGASIALSAGDYVVCDFKTGRNAVVRGTGARILVNGGSFKSNNGSKLGLKCGDLEVFVSGGGSVSFGRKLEIYMKLCAPASSIKLGHGNTLKGQFVGDTVNSDLGNTGACCDVGRCVCYDVLTPNAGAAGATITATGKCDMTPVTEVQVCDVVAPIISKTVTEVKFTVPAVPGPLPKQCKVEFISPAGTYEGTAPFTVNP